MATTSERGLGSEHQKARAVLLPLAYGRQCPLCGRQMTKSTPLHLDHKKSRALGGTGEMTNLQMVHARCNLRKAGLQFGRLGASARRPRVRQLTPVFQSRW